MDHTGFVQAHGVCFLVLHCSGCRVLCRALSKAGPGFHALLRSNLLRFRFSDTLGTLQGHRLLGVRFVPFPGLSSSGEQVLGQHTLPGGPCILITSLVSGVPFVSSGELISGCDSPGRCQPSRIPERCG